MQRFFYFYIFYFCFLQKYIFDLEIYRNIPRLSGGRDLAARQPGGRGLSAKKKTTKNCSQVRGNRPPGSGAAGPQAARQLDGQQLQGDRLNHFFFEL